MKKLKKIFLYIILLLTLCFIGIKNPIKADSGWDSSYDSSGSWDSGGSSWSSSSGSYYSSSSGDLDGTTVIIIFIVIVIIVIISSKNNNNKFRGGSSSNISNTNSYHDIDINKIKEIDKDFDISKFKEDVYNIYKDIQVAWMNFDEDKIRSLTTDEVYNMYKSQLETLKLKKQKNIMKDFNLIDVKIIDIKKEKDVIEVKAYLNVTCYDYVIKEETNEVVRGDSRHKINIKYELTFVKSASNNKKEEKCPNCGAKVDIVSSSTCPYCNSTLVKDASTYVMSKKTCVGQTMER